MDLHISLGPRGHWSRDLYAQLRSAILDGRLRAGDSLPATRALAERLDLSRNTVMNAYERLTAEGFLAAKVGAGTFVCETVTIARRGAMPRVLTPLARWELLRPSQRPTLPFDFRLGVPDPSLFPWDAWRRLIAKQWRGPRQARHGYGAPAGEHALRAAIARYVGVSRAVRADAGDVIVTAGAQQAFDLIARVLVEPGVTVAVEDPGYPPARHAFAAHGARIAPVAVDREGLVVDDLPDDARIVYVTPSHQFPLGTPMSLARRLALCAWAKRRRAAIVEDDYDSELRYEGRPLEPLHAVDRSGHVIYVGTFSKILAPSLRLGFAIAPASLVPALAAARSITDWHGPLEAERALAGLIDDGTFARHVRRVLRVYRERRDRLVEALASIDALDVLPSGAGLHVAATFRDLRDSDAIAARAQERGVGVSSLRAYHAGRPREGLALGFGLIASNQIDEGVARLASAIAHAPARTGSRRRR